jgi:tetratricopeptide (TPR) repeat protein
MAYDAGQQAVASRYLSNALRNAQLAGGQLLAGRILTAMSHQAIHVGHFKRAVELAEAAREITASIATPRATAMEAAMQACAYAAIRDARQAHRALDEAADAVARIGDGQPGPDWLDFDEGGFWGHAARAYRDLGELRPAEESAGKAVTLCLPGHGRTRAQRNTILATASLRLGNLEAAAAVGEQIVAEAWMLHSGHVLNEVADLAAALDPFRAVVASGFLEQARELLAARRPAFGAGNRVAGPSPCRYR